MNAECVCVCRHGDRSQRHHVAHGLPGKRDWRGLRSVCLPRHRRAGLEETQGAHRTPVRTTSTRIYALFTHYAPGLLDYGGKIIITIILVNIEIMTIQTFIFEFENMYLLSMSPKKIHKMVKKKKMFPFKIIYFRLEIIQICIEVFCPFYKKIKLKIKKQKTRLCYFCDRLTKFDYLPRRTTHHIYYTLYTI